MSTSWAIGEGFVQLFGREEADTLGLGGAILVELLNLAGRIEESGGHCGRTS